MKRSSQNDLHNRSFCLLFHGKNCRPKLLRTRDRTAIAQNESPTSKITGSQPVEMHFVNVLGDSAGESSRTKTRHDTTSTKIVLARRPQHVSSSSMACFQLIADARVNESCCGCCSSDITAQVPQRRPGLQAPCRAPPLPTVTRPVFDDVPGTYFMYRAS